MGGMFERLVAFMGRVLNSSDPLSSTRVFTALFVVPFALVFAVAYLKAAVVTNTVPDVPSGVTFLVAVLLGSGIAKTIAEKK